MDDKVPGAGERVARAAYNELYGPGAAEHGQRFASKDWLNFREAITRALTNTKDMERG